MLLIIICLPLIHLISTSLKFQLRIIEFSCMEHTLELNIVYNGTIVTPKSGTTFLFTTFRGHTAVFFIPITYKEFPLKNYKTQTS